MAVTKTKARKSGGKAGVLKGSIIVLVMVAAMVGYYYHLSNRNRQQNAEEAEMTVAQELLSRNLSTNYPPTPKEVVKYYSDITRCFYNEEYSEEELKKLVDKTFQLYDDELLE